jgi:hypothetical protein
MPKCQKAGRVKLVSIPRDFPHFRGHLIRPHFSAAALVVASAALWLSPNAKAANFNVPAGGNLQAALDAAQPGDQVILQSGATFQGNFVLRKKAASTSRITITSTLAGYLPIETRRISPSVHAPYLARIVTPNANPALWTENGASNYNIRGIEFTTAPGTNPYVYDLVRLGPLNATAADQLGENFTVSHSWFHGDETVGGKQGILMHAANVVIKNSAIDGFFSSWQETHGIMCFAGPGPYNITNNYLEASGMPILFGGAAPKIVGLTPSNVVIQSNHMTRPLAWKGLYAVKNLLEIKHGRNFSIKQNLLENNWAAAQDGYGVLFTVRTCESGDYSWAVVDNIDFRENVVRNTPQGVNILGQDYHRAPCAKPGTGTISASGTSVFGSGTKFLTELKPTDKVVAAGVTLTVASIVSNVMLTLTAAAPTTLAAPASFTYYAAAAGQLSNVKVVWNSFEGITGNAFQIQAGAKNVNVTNNTAVSNPIQNAMLIGSGAPSTGLYFQNNVMTHGRYGVTGTGTAIGKGTLTAYFPGSFFRKNVIVGAGTSQQFYPTDNFFPATFAEAGFIDAAGGNYGLSPASPYWGKGEYGETPGVKQSVLDQVRSLVPEGRSTVFFLR